jgi:cytochrome d ubiquinol oxidase subunit II
MDCIAPFWDGNETWLIVTGAGLYAAFPSVYTVFLGAFYLPVLVLLIGLIFRGIAFEFRRRAQRTRPLWDWGFCLGSTAVAFVQGAAIGAMMRGIPVTQGELAGAQFAGGAFDWLAPFPILTGIGLVLGYALLGAGWVVGKGEGELRDWGYRRIPWLTAAVLAVLVLAFTLTLHSGEVPRGNLAGRPWGLAFPVLGLLALAGTLYGVRRRRDRLPFAMTLLFFLAAYLTLGTMFWPYMLPYRITVASAAAPEASLRFLFLGAGVVVLPVMLIYTGAVYWVFRGKVRQGDGD